MADPSELHSIVRAIAQRDEESRKARATRTVKLHDLIKEYPWPIIGLHGGGMESARLLYDAMSSYVAGLFVATIVCAHASCERELAAYLNAQPGELPKRWERWGLGQLVSYFSQHDLLTEDAVHELQALNDLRRGIYHFRDLASPEGLAARVLSLLPDASDESSLEFGGRTFPEELSLGMNIDLDVERMLERGALLALRSSFTVRKVGDEIGRL